MLKRAISKLVERINLTEEEACQVMEVIMTGQASDGQIAALITALRMKGETSEEVTGFARVMRDKATAIATKHPLVVDTCGTGGDGSNTFNISTTAAFVLAGAGLPVAKHGNRSVSSKSGSADVLEACGVNLNISPELVSECLDNLGIGFLYAPALHGAMKYAIGPRREIGIRTVFNLLGPLTNPARAQVQVLGVYQAELTEVIAQVLQKLGTRRALVVHGAGGLDEASLAGPTKITEVSQEQIRTFFIQPEEVGLGKVDLPALRGGTAQENAQITKRVLQGVKGPQRNVVLLNAALGLVAGNRAEDLREGVEVAAQSIDSGAALDKLEQLVSYTSQLPRRAIS